VVGVGIVVVVLFALVLGLTLLAVVLVT